MMHIYNLLFSIFFIYSWFRYLSALPKAQIQKMNLNAGCQLWSPYHLFDNSTAVGIGREGKYEGFGGEFKKKGE